MKYINLFLTFLNAVFVGFVASMNSLCPVSLQILRFNIIFLTRTNKSFIENLNKKLLLIKIMTSLN